MNYTLHQLQIFVSVCKLGSITKASEELFLTQPAVSIQLKKLQDQFDIPLTERIGRNIHITDFGHEIAKAAKRILSEAATIDGTVSQYKGLLAGKIKLSVVSTGKYVIPYFLSEFIQKHPAIEVVIDVTNKAKVVESLEKNETDFALVSVLPQNMEVERVELMKNHLFLVAGAEEQVDTDQYFSRKELNTKTLIYREQGSATRNAMEEFLVSKNIEPHTRLELVSNEAVKQAVCAGVGYSIVPLIGMKGELEQNKLQIVPVKGLPIETFWNLIHRKGKGLSPAAKSLKEHINTHKDHIITKYFSNDQSVL